MFKSAIPFASNYIQSDRIKDKIRDHNGIAQWQNGDLNFWKIFVAATAIICGSSGCKRGLLIAGR